jgi:hypothetical protein
MARAIRATIRSVFGAVDARALDLGGIRGGVMLASDMLELRGLGGLMLACDIVDLSGLGGLMLALDMADLCGLGGLILT